MAFCSLDKTFAESNFTSIENGFIKNYMLDADGMATKVYLYGLYLCQNMPDEFSDKEFAENLNISVEEVAEYFKYWQEFDLVTIISINPLTVKYQPLPKTGKPRKYKVEKYSDFSISLQALLPKRMITPTEFAEYYDLMETTNIKPESLLMIIKYCADYKGEDISYKYISKTVKNFADKGITSLEAVEKELSSYNARTGEVAEIVKALGGKAVNINASETYNNWLSLGYDKETLLYLCSVVKKKDFNYLNGFISSLAEKSLYSIKEISAYLENKKSLTDTAKKICNALSYRCEIIDTFISVYLSAWQGYGYDNETLIFIANYLFRRNVKTPDKMDEFIKILYADGYITLDNVGYFIEKHIEKEKIIRNLLSLIGINRKPIQKDFESLESWTSWGFSVELIEYAFSLASDKINPFSYANAILSKWKQANIFDLETAKKHTGQDGGTSTSPNSHFGAERHYTKEQLDSFIKSDDDLDF